MAVSSCSFLIDVGSSGANSGNVGNRNLPLPDDKFCIDVENLYVP